MEMTKKTPCTTIADDDVNGRRGGGDKLNDDGCRFRAARVHATDGHYLAGVRRGRSYGNRRNHPHHRAG